MKSHFYFVGFPKLHFTAAVGEYHARCKYSYFVLNCTFFRRKCILHFHSTNSSAILQTKAIELSRSVSHIFLSAAVQA